MPEVITKAGTPLNLGATITPNGVNFSIYSKDASAVSLCLFESDMAAKPYAVISFDPVKNRTGDIWHIELCGEGDGANIGEGTLYLYKVDGPYEPTRGLRFNKNKYLFDPYAKAFTIGSVFRSYNKQHRMGFSANEGGELQDLSDFPKCVVVDDSFDW